MDQFPNWKNRNELSRESRLRRSYYELLRDGLTQFVADYALKDSYENFIKAGLDYPFVERKELKPRARIPKQEYELQNSLLLIFAEDSIPESHKKYIRFFDSNRTTKTNLMRSKTLLMLGPDFDRNCKYLESISFYNFLKELLPVDYALLIQRDTATAGSRNRYCISHFHVRIDWPITEAAEDLARHLRYISKDIYEKGESCAESLQKKFFEYYGLPEMIGGRRTAASVAAHYFRKLPFITTVYVSSTESRSLICYNEYGVSKTVLLRLTSREISKAAGAGNLLTRDFKNNYMLHKDGREGIFMFRADYAPTIQAIPPEDGKLRDLKPELFWLTVKSQYILPRSDRWSCPPLAYNYLYS